ncbi:RAP domain-containing protein, chloroplastic [Coccomyxa sp. Obi]|nr:RAP domain-containing protein, chloroplastic [Coccomyxa sp. Obi]
MPSWFGFIKPRTQGRSRLWVAAVRRRHRAYKPSQTSAVPTQSENDAPTLSSGRKPVAYGNTKLQAVQHLRNLAHAAKGMPMPGRLSKARDAPIKELLLMSGLSPGATSLSGATVEALGSKGLADMLWALAGLGGVPYFQKEMDAVLEAVDFHRQDFPVDALVDIAWALAEVTHWTPKIADLAEALKLQGGLKHIKNFGLIPLLWSFAVLNYNPAGLLADTLLSHRVGSMNPHKLINACWSLCVLEQMRCQIFKELWEELGSRDLADMHMTECMASQLCQIKMSLTDEEGFFPVSKTLEGVFVEADRLWKPILGTTDYHMSAQHADMCRALRSMGMEYVIEDVSSGYAVDIAIPSLRIAVEIDGPSHFARNADRRLGPSAMKHRHLSKRGWKVFSVTAQDWASARSSITALANLRDLIAEQRSTLQD